MKLAELKTLSTSSKQHGTAHAFNVGFDDNQTKYMEGLHQKHFSKTWLLSTKLQGAEYRKKAYAYLVEANFSGIHPADAIRFHRAKVYDISKRLTEDCSGGQLPGTIVASNSSSDYLVQILSDGIGWVTTEKKRAGNAFGGTMNLRENNQIASMTSDAAFVSYMLGHTIGDKGNPFQTGVIAKGGKLQKDALIPYILFSCAYGAQAEKGGKTEMDVIHTALERRKKFVADWRKTGFVVCKEDDPYISPFNKKDGTHPKIYIPVILHDLKHCKFYVIRKDGKKTEFSKWAGELGLDEIDIVKKHIAAMEEHAKETAYFDEFTQLSGKKKESFCVDSRHTTEIGAMLKDLGAVLNEETIWKVLTNPKRIKFSIRLHTECGYLTTAMKIHELGLEIGRRLNKLKERIRAREDMGGLSVKDVEWTEKHFRRLVMEILRKKRPSENEDRRIEIAFDYAKFDFMLRQAEKGDPMPEYMQQILHDMLNDSLSDTRNTLKHMAGRDILEWNRELNTISMISAKHIDDLVGPNCPLLQANRKNKSNTAELQAAYYNLVTLAFAVDELDFWHAMLVGNEKQLIEGRKKAAEKLKIANQDSANELPTIRVKIENINTGEIIEVSEWPKLTEEFRKELDSMQTIERLHTVLEKIILKDAITGQTI